MKSLHYECSLFYNLLIAWHLIRTSTAGSAKNVKHSVFPKPTVSCSKSKYCIPLSCRYSDILYFDFEQDTVGFGKTECFSILAEPFVLVRIRCQAINNL